MRGAVLVDDDPAGSLACAGSGHGDADHRAAGALELRGSAAGEDRGKRLDPLPAAASLRRLPGGPLLRCRLLADRLALGDLIDRLLQWRLRCRRGLRLARPPNWRVAVQPGGESVGTGVRFPDGFLRLRPRNRFPGARVDRGRLGARLRRGLLARLGAGSLLVRGGLLALLLDLCSLCLPLACHVLLIGLAARLRRMNRLRLERGLGDRPERLVAAARKETGSDAVRLHVVKRPVQRRTPATARHQAPTSNRSATASSSRQ